MSIETDAESWDQYLEYVIMDSEWNEISEDDDTPYTACIRALWTSFHLEGIKALNERLYSIEWNICYQPYYCAPESTNSNDWDIAKIIWEQITIN
jgi:hypothetical protein